MTDQEPLLNNGAPQGVEVLPPQGGVPFNGNTGMGYGQPPM
jgi:hypothetical protein